MASFVTHFLNVMFRHMPIIEDTEEERRQNAARPLPKPPKGVTVGDAGLSVPCELIEKQGNGDIYRTMRRGYFLMTARYTSKQSSKAAGSLCSGASR